MPPKSANYYVIIKHDPKQLWNQHCKAFKSYKKLSKVKKIIETYQKLTNKLSKLT